MQTEKARYYGQFEPQVDRFLHERYFSSTTTPGTLIECGAFDGEYESSGKFFEEALGWRAINIEPSTDIFQKLVKNRPQSRNLNLALSNYLGVADFSNVSYPGYELCTNGSLQHLTPHRNSLDSAGCTYALSRVSVTTFNQLVQDLGLNRIDLMILDVEGHELEALEGFEGAAVLPRVLCVEHGHLGVYPVQAAAEKLGYEFDIVSHVNSFFILRE